ncbi:MAG: hypothetical protein FWG28_05965 [Clostridiales bacterium]|nr:hypothetical protein [Clostridiales bacterium]
MKHHFVVCAVLKPHLTECQASVGAVCREEELGGWMKAHGILRYKVKSIDRKPVADWEKTDWVVA